MDVGSVTFIMLRVKVHHSCIMVANLNRIASRMLSEQFSSRNDVEGKN
uniref:Alternative protein NANP n=1 Tax=Homo sapiens TaxID=9606 RepID=L8EBE6_HUMAN|nr:alternative protein NANP [Homo sapiens]